MLTKFVNGIVEICTAEEEADIRASWIAAPINLSPVAVTPWQIRSALNAQGLRSAVEAAVSASGNQELKDGWEFSLTIVRDSPLVIGLATALGKTDAEIDALFALAVTL